MATLKNKTNDDLVFAKQIIPSNGEYAIRDKEEFKFATSKELKEAIIAKKIVVNDGERDLKFFDGWRYLRYGNFGNSERGRVQNIAYLLDKHSDNKKDKRFINKRISDMEEKFSSEDKSYVKDLAKKVKELEAKLSSKEDMPSVDHSAKIESLENKLSEMKTMYREVIKNQKLIIASKDSLQEYINSPTDDFQYGTMGIVSKKPLDFEQGEINEYMLAGGPGNSELHVEIKLYLDDVLSDEVLVKWADFNQTFMKIEVDAGLGAAEAAGDNSDSLLSWKFKDFVTQTIKLDINVIGSCEVKTTFRSKSHDDCKGICPSIGSGALEIKGITFNEVNYN